jgi:hypothetical protein
LGSVQNKNRKTKPHHVVDQWRDIKRTIEKSYLVYNTRIWWEAGKDVTTFNSAKTNRHGAGNLLTI